MVENDRRGMKQFKFSEESRNQILERIKSGEFDSYREVMNTFHVCKKTVSDWAKKIGYSFATFREADGQNPICRDGDMDSRSDRELKEKWKDHPFVEPDPGVESFRTEKDALEYYKLRAEYLENLYMLADSPSEVKKKVLQQLDERIRQKMGKGGTSV